MSLCSFFLSFYKDVTLGHASGISHLTVGCARATVAKPIRIERVSNGNVRVEETLSRRRNVIAHLLQHQLHHATVCAQCLALLVCKCAPQSNCHSHQQHGSGADLAAMPSHGSAKFWTPSFSGSALCPNAHSSRLLSSAMFRSSGPGSWPRRQQHDCAFERASLDRHLAVASNP